jgi:hypothetical protein
MLSPGTDTVALGVAAATPGLRGASCRVAAATIPVRSVAIPHTSKPCIPSRNSVASPTSNGARMRPVMYPPSPYDASATSTRYRPDRKTSAKDVSRQVGAAELTARFDADHSYGAACYQAGGCADIIDAVAQGIDARQFNPGFPQPFPRFVQHAIWRYCAQSGLDVCNRQIRSHCDRIVLSKPQ